MGKWNEIMRENIKKYIYISVKKKFFNIKEKK